MIEYGSLTGKDRGRVKGMTMDELRARMDRIDSEMVRLYAERMETARQIGRLKREHGLPVRDPKREEELLRRVEQEAGEENREGVRALFTLLMAHSRDRQIRDGEVDR